MHVSQRLAALIVVDISGSMAALDLQVDGRQSSRLDAVKQTFRTFVQGGKNLTGRDGDLIGMVTFARYPDSVCPLTSDHDTLLALLDQVEIVTLQEEDGTAIGEGIALGVERLKDSAACSRVMILLTDGVNDCQDHWGCLRASGDTDDRPRPHLRREDRSQGTPADDHDQAGTLYPPLSMVCARRLEGKVKYNLGNVEYQQALQNLQRPQEALPHLRAVMTYSRDSLDIDPQPQDAQQQSGQQQQRRAKAQASQIEKDW